MQRNRPRTETIPMACVAAVAAVLIFTLHQAIHITHIPDGFADSEKFHLSRRLFEGDTPSEHEQQVISASANLISLEFASDHSVDKESYTGITGVFCHILDFDKQKKDPNKVPMFRDLVHASGCDHEQNLFRVDLKRVVDLARNYDMKVFQENYNSASLDTNEEPSVLSLKGAVFHESRCGSTLTANALVALDPKKNRVYSESTPPKQVLKMCEEDFSKCSVEVAANLLRDVIYIMGRSDDPNEENLFFKFQSTTTRTMQIFRTAFPTTPWIFLYREPIEVIQSHLDKIDVAMANCVRNYKKSSMIKLMARKLRVKLKDLQGEEICAIHLATICGAAIFNLEDANGLGMTMRYHTHMSSELLDYIFPIHFHLPIDKNGSKRVFEVAQLYSKSKDGEEVVFKSDKEKKRNKASMNVKDAAFEFLDPSYNKLETSEYNMNKICNQINLNAKVANNYCRSSRRKRL